MYLINGILHTMASDVIRDGFVSFEHGKITAAGRMDELQLPEQAEVLDVTGCHIYPGLVDAHSHLGMFGDSLGFESDDGNEITDPVTPQLRAIDAINPFDRCFEEARMRGITAAASCPGSANACGGEICVVKTYGRQADSMLVKNCGIKFALGENPKRVYNDKGETPVTRMATAAIIREGLYKSRRYAHDMDIYYSDNENYEPPEYDIKCEALMPLLERKQKAFFHCHRADDICTAMRIAKEFSLELVIIHGTEGYKIADILAAEDIPVICGPIICDRCKPEMRGLELKNAAVLAKNGVKTAICTDHTVIPIQYLPISALAAVKGGLEPEQALRSLTITPAEILGIDDRTGSLTAGKDADIQLYAAGVSPLELMSDPRLVIIGGVTVKKEV